MFTCHSAADSAKQQVANGACGFREPWPVSMAVRGDSARVRRAQVGCSPMEPTGSGGALGRAGQKVHGSGGSCGTAKIFVAS